MTTEKPQTRQTIMDAIAEGAASIERLSRSAPPPSPQLVIASCLNAAAHQCVAIGMPRDEYLSLAAAHYDAQTDDA